MKPYVSLTELCPDLTDRVFIFISCNCSGDGEVQSYPCPYTLPVNIGFFDSGG